MVETDERAQSIVYILADHLFAAIEAGNNILNYSFTPPPLSHSADEADRIYGELDTVSTFIRTIETYEDDFSSKINQARKWCEYLRNIDPHFRSIIDLFMSATKPLIRINRAIQARHDRDFDAADHYDWFFQNRHICVVKDNDGFLEAFDCDETYLIGGELRLFELVELADQFLTALETRYTHLWHAVEELSNDTIGSQPHHEDPS